MASEPFVWWHNIHAPLSPMELWQGPHNQKYGDRAYHRPMLHPRATRKWPRQILVLNNNGRSAQLESSYQLLPPLDPNYRRMVGSHRTLSGLKLRTSVAG